MNDKERLVQEERIRKLSRRWLKPLRLTGWSVLLVYSDGPFDLDGSKDHEAAAAAKVRWPYYQATLTFDLQQCERMSDRQLQECFVHECFHVLVHEMREWRDGLEAGALDHEERVVTQLAWIALGMARRKSHKVPARK